MYEVIAKHYKLIELKFSGDYLVESTKKSFQIKVILLRLFCGQESQETALTVSEEEREAIRRKMTSIDETPFWRKVLNINAVITAAVCFFLHAFWG